MRDNLEIVDTFFSIRAYCPQDADAVWRIERLSYAPEEIHRKAVIVTGCTDLTRIVIDRMRFGVVGMLGHLPLSSRRVHIFSLAVHPEFRRFGYGNYLMNHAKIDAAQHHPRAILQTIIDERDTGAAHFLKSSGFTGKTWADEFIKFEFRVK